MPRWGERSAATVLAHYEHIEAIPDDALQWKVAVRGAAGLADNLREHREAALLYRVLATLRTDVPLRERIDDLYWRGVSRPDLVALCGEIGGAEIIERVHRWQD